MTSLIKLLAVDVPPGTRLKDAELHFRGLFPWWVALLLLALLGAIAIRFYLSERAKLSRLARIALATLRIGLFAILLFLLSRPLLLAEFEGERARAVGVLLDKSQSMSLRDRRLSSEDQARVAVAYGKLPITSDVTKTPPPSDLPKDPSRRDLAEAILTHPELKLPEALAKVGPLRTYWFGSRLQSLHEEGDTGDPGKGLVKDYRADDASTSLADAILEILQRKDGDLPTALVAITDGRDNASKASLAEAAQEAARLGVPLHVVGLGSSDSGSLQLKEVVAPATLFAEDTVSIPIRWRAQGLKKGTIEIAIQLGGQTVVRKEVPVRAGDDLRETLSFLVPKGKDDETLKLTASLQLKGNDAFKDSFAREVRLIDRKIKVLVIEHAPRFEYRFLQAALLRDKRFDATFLLANADPKVAQGGPPYLPEFPKQRDKFFEGRWNVIVLGDVAPAFLSKDGMEWIKEFVANRGGLVLVSGRQHLPGAYENHPLAETFPIEFGAYKAKPAVDDRTAEYPPTLTDVGLRTDMMFLGDSPDDNAKAWQELPGFHWAFPATKLRAGATSLVVNPRAKMGDQPLPVFASQFYGKGQVFFAGTDETWRWRANQENKLFTRFWGQVIYQMGLPSLLDATSSRTQVALDRAEAVLGRPGAVFVRMLDKDFNPRKEQRLEATLEHLDAGPGQERIRKIALASLPGRDGDYQAFLSHDKPGRYELRVNNPEPTTFSFRVDPPPRHELEDIGLAEKELRDLASGSGGRFYREEDLHRLAKEVTPRSTTFVRRQELLLWNPLMFLAFLALITAEWVARKFSNLM